MFKKVLLAAAILMASPTIVSAQDIFWSFDSESKVTNRVDLDGGTAYIFSDGLFGFDALDLDFSVSESPSGTLLFTGGTAFNDPFDILPGSAFNSSVVTIDSGGKSGNLFSANITQNGINPLISENFNPHFRPGVGPNGGVLLAELNFIAGFGEAILEFTLGSQGALQLPSTVLSPSFGSATHVNTIPEPSSLALLMLGSVGLIARRNRS